MNIKPTIKKTSAIILLLTICFAIYYVNKDAEIVYNKNQSMPNLTGEEAKDYLKEQGLYESLGEAMAASRYSIYQTKNAPLPNTDEAFEANNPKQSFSTYFAKDGIHLVSKAKNNKWRVQMNLKGYSNGDELTKLKETKAEVQKNKSRIELTKTAKDQSKITEWYENSADGLEQGWTINEKLSDSDNDLKLILELGGDLTAKLAKDNQSIRFVKDNKQILTYDKLKSWDANGKDLTSRMELKDKELSIVVDESDATYPITIDPFFQTKKLTASDAAAGDFFGFSVGISGDTAIVGSPGDADAGTQSGSAYIFDRNNGSANNWGEVKKITASDAATFDEFGLSVGISGDTAIVGAHRNGAGTNIGAAYIFDRNTGGANNWGEVKKITASDAATFDAFGESVGISGNTAIVGARRSDDAGNDSGSAYIFDRNNGGANNWGEVKKLTASDADSGDQFSWSVGISGDTAIVGAHQNDDGAIDSGSAYIFDRNNGGANNWGEIKKLTASDAVTEEDRFGSSVGISGDLAIVGARGKDISVFDADRGSAYIFDRNNGGANNWGEVKKITASDADDNDQFGWSVGISSDTAIVGAIFNDDGGSSSGSAYIFDRNNGGANNWGEVKKITASDADGFDDFGSSVGISGNATIVGAGGNADAGASSGSAYIFDNIQSTGVRADFDGDNRTDLSVYRPSEGNWYLNRSASGSAVIKFGIATDTLVPADYDGDGITDVAVFRPTNTVGQPDFYILNSSNNTLRGSDWGLVGDIPVVGDYDGDGKDDVAIWRESNTTWYSQNSSNNTANIDQYGSAGDIPIVGDWDGDGTVRPSIYRPSNNTWYLAKPTGTPGTNFDTIPFGTANDILVPGDYDGDSKTDVAVFRPSTGDWYIQNSGNGMTTITPFGTMGDIPTPGDYDGDGKEDLAIYRAGQWWITNSSNGTVSTPTYGLATDIPIPSKDSH